MRIITTSGGLSWVNDEIKMRIYNRAESMTIPELMVYSETGSKPYGSHPMSSKQQSARAKSARAKQARKACR